MLFLHSLWRKILFVAIIAVVPITLASWSMPLTSSMFTDFLYSSDTIPHEQNKRMEELNKALAELQKAKSGLLEKDVANEVALALKQINLQQIQSSVSDALMNANAALKNTDTKKIRIEIDAILTKIDMEKINEQVKIVTQNLQPQINESLEAAKKQIEQAELEIERARKKLRNKCS